VGKQSIILISYFLSNTYAKIYRNRVVYVKIIASEMWDVFWDTVYMHTAAVYAAFVMTVSAAKMYLRHAQHARDINIHKLNQLPEKIRLGPLRRFYAQWNRLH